MHSKGAFLNTAHTSLQVWLNLLLPIEYAATQPTTSELAFGALGEKYTFSPPPPPPLPPPYSSQMDAFLQYRRGNKDLRRIYPTASEFSLDSIRLEMVARVRSLVLRSVVAT